MGSGGWVTRGIEVNALGPSPELLTALAEKSVVSGGAHNEVYGDRSVVAGGARNVVHGKDTTIAGGFENTAVGDQSTVSGGYQMRKFPGGHFRQARRDRRGRTGSL